MQLSVFYFDFNNITDEGLFTPTRLKITNLKVVRNWLHMEIRQPLNSTFKIPFFKAYLNNLYKFVDHNDFSIHFNLLISLNDSLRGTHS